MLAQTRLYTIDEFEAFLAHPENEERIFELIDGEIIEKVPTQEHGMIVLRFGSRILFHVETHQLGRVGTEIRHQKPEDKRYSLLPDISFYADTTSPVVKHGAFPRMPDLAIEVKSPHDSLRKMRDKARYYLANGTLLVWLLYPELRMVEVFTPDDEYLLSENEILTGGDVLPGFEILIAEIFHV